MYKHDPIGPWPIIDPMVSATERASGMVTQLNHGTLNVCMETTGLSGTEGWLHNRYTDTSASIPAWSNVAYGVCLSTPQLLDYPKDMIGIDMSYASAFSTGSNIFCYPFVGMKAGIGGQIAGWSTPTNLVMDYNLIPERHGQSYQNRSGSLHFYLKDLGGGAMTVDDPICVGIMLWNNSGASVTIGENEIQIYARIINGCLKTFGNEG